MSKNATNSKVMTVSLQSSRYGKLQPQLALRMPPKTPQDAVMTALHMLASELELSTPDQKGWSIRVELWCTPDGRFFDDLADGTVVKAALWCWNGGGVYLDLVDGTVAEATRAMALLNEVVAAVEDRERAAG